MNHKALPVAGYTDQPDDKVRLVNSNKMTEEVILRQLDEMRDDVVKFDQRWLAIARTHFEEAFMSLNRAIFKPQRISDKQYAELTNASPDKG